MIRTLEKIRDTLEVCGGSLDDLLRCEVYLADMHDKPAMNEVWKQFFPSNPPARTTLQVGLEGAMKVEVVSVAYLGNTSPENKGE